MPETRKIGVVCTPAEDGWTCDVTLAADSERSRHQVAIRPQDLARLEPGATEPGRLVRRSFEFLLEREPARSILRSFDLTDIGRYFPEYEAEIRRG